MAFNQLPLAPLGAGDLIDRSVRLYRRHFVTLLRMAAPPVLVSSVGSVLWALGVRGIDAHHKRHGAGRIFLRRWDRPAALHRQ
ncbi:MAG: hypothetical protein WKF84_18945 [Pyrinomonadaceae bacterium]